MNLSPSIQQLFNTAYWLSQPLPVQALASITNPAAVLGLAKQLALQGYIIDYPIMVMGDMPYFVMSYRFAIGLKWDASLLQSPITTGPGGQLMFGSIPYNPAAPPAGAIIVPPMNELTAPGVDVAQLLAQWYPSSIPAPPPPPPPPAGYVLGPLVANSNPAIYVISWYTGNPPAVGQEITAVSASGAVSVTGSAVELTPFGEFGIQVAANS
jgi:hypothetical protein